MNKFFEDLKQYRIQENSIEENSIEEQAQAKKGDWKGGYDFIRNFSHFTIQTDYVFVDNIVVEKLGEISLYKHKINLAYFAGVFIEETVQTKLGNVIEERFNAVFSIAFNPIKLKDYKNCVEVKGVTVSDSNETYKKSGVSMSMYKYFVKTLKYTIVGDSEQYFGARKLWAKLSTNIDVKVDIYDIKKQELIYPNVILHHGNYNNDFDKRLWSFTKDKYYLRSILTEII